jgi:hypothetical protein
MKNIPIKAAKDISKAHEAPIVIIFALDPVTGRQHVTTYGDTVAHCEAAARGGNVLKKHLGWPEDLCNAVPARARKKGAQNPALSA